MLKRLLIAFATTLLLGLLVDSIYFGGLAVLPLNSYAWMIFVGRLAIGFFVAIVGIVTIHPVFGFKMFPLRGIFVGLWIALIFALNAASPLTELGVFLAILALGAFNGLVVDVVATRYAGDGKKLLHKDNE